MINCPKCGCLLGHRPGLYYGGSWRSSGEYYCDNPYCRWSGDEGNRPKKDPKKEKKNEEDK